jgi:glycosyltransferase involved in cell wall biosynthesis
MAKETKHICFIASNLHRSDARIYKRQGASLNDASFRVSYLLSGDGILSEINGIEIHSLKFDSKTRYSRFFRRTHLFFKKAIELDADIYQISEPEMISLGLLLIGKGYKVVLDLREDYVQDIINREYIPRYLRRIVSNIFRRYLRFAMPQFDYVFCVDPHLLDIANKIVKLENSVCVTNFPIVTAHSSYSLGEYLERENMLIYSGSVYKESRQELLFKSLVGHSNLRYVIVGKFWSDYQTQLESLSYWNSLQFFDGSDSMLIDEWIRKSTIGNAIRDFSETNFKQGSLGVIKIYEYMEAALPIICSDVSLWKSMVDKYRCGICVDPNNLEQLDDALKFLLENKEEAYEMGQRGRKAIEIEYNWKSQSRIYIKAIESVLK